ncbi:MAG TPA: polysaccharide deacetylase family protein [Firmicutes bacterium]|nr:polysaccharide deacetylase family protein [Bacillota bacterium]
MRKLRTYIIILLVLQAAAAAAGSLRNVMPPYLRGFQETVQRQAEKYPEYFHLSGGAAEKKIALTFDDGPHKSNTPLILDILKSRDIKATFFVLGENVKKHPEIIHRINEAGHQIGNHSKTHSDLRNLTNEEILKTELDPTSHLIEAITGTYPKFMRPPYGALRDESIEFLGELGWQIINWSIDSFDWDQAENEAEEILSKIEEYHHPGAIILLHCSGPNTALALPKIISLLETQDYDFVTVEELLKPKDKNTAFFKQLPKVKELLRFFPTKLSR